MGTGAEIALYALVAAGTAATIVSQQQQAKSQEKWANYQADQAQADANAAAGAANVRADRIRRAARYQQAEAQAGYAASGVDVGEGTPVKIDAKIAGNAEHDAMLTILDGQTQQGRGGAEAVAFRGQGRDARSAANSASVATLINAGASAYGGWKSTNAAGGVTAQQSAAPVVERGSTYIG